MAERVFVIGVGMTDFVKPSARPDWDYPDMVREAGTQALEDAGVTYDADRARRRRLLLRRYDGRPARRLRARSHRRPGREREQRLRERLDRVHGVAQRRRGGHGGLCAGDRLREDGPLHAVHGSRLSARSPHGGDGVAPREQRRAHHRADVRQRRARAHGTLRHARRSRSRASPSRITSTRCTTRAPSSARSSASKRCMASPALYPPLTLLQSCPTSSGAAAAVVASERFVREHGLGDPRGRDRGPGDGDRLLEHVLRRRHRDDRRGSHPRRRAPRLRAGGARSGRRRRDRAARLLLDQRAHHLRGPRPLRARQGWRAHRLGRHDLRRPLGREPERRPDLEGPSDRRDRARAVRRAHLATPRRGRRRGRWMARASGCSTTSGSAARRW